MKRVGALLIFMVVAASATASLAHADSMAYVHYSRGIDFAAQGNFSGAKESFDRALAVDPQHYPTLRCMVVLKDIREGRIKEHTGVYLFRAFSAYNRYKTDDAIQALNKAAELDPGYAPVYFHRGVAYRDKKLSKEALEDYNKTLEIDPKYAPAYISRANLYCDQSQFDLAIADYGRALETEPCSVIALYSRGNAYEAQGRHQQAIADYDRIFEINPGFPHAYVGKALVYEKTGRPKEALAVLKAYLDKVDLSEQEPAQVKWVSDKVTELEKLP